MRDFGLDQRRMCHVGDLRVGRVLRRPRYLVASLDAVQRLTNRGV